MVKSPNIKVKIFIVFLLAIILVINVGLISGEEIIKEGNDTTILYESSSYTQKDDLSLNTYNGLLTAKDELIETSSNGEYKLYLNRDLMIFKLENTITNYIYQSGLDSIVEGSASEKLYAPYMSSSIVLEYYLYNEEKQDLSTEKSFALINLATKLSKEEKALLEEDATYHYKLSLRDGNIVEYSDIDSGIKVSINYSTLGISLSLYVSISDDGLSAYIPDEEIIEGKNVIGDIILFPAMGANFDNTNKGYMVIPDGPGALYRFGSIKNEDAYAQELSYYDDLKFGKTLNAPIFGIVNGIKQDAVYGVIESGATIADLLISPSGSLGIDYNYLALRFDKRRNYLSYGVTETIIETRDKEDIKVLYKFLSGDEATYIGLAKDYQTYLSERGELVKTTSGEFTTQIDFLLNESAKAIIGKKNVNMTKIKDVRDYLKYFEEAGIDKTISVLKGWNSKGYSGSTPYKISYNLNSGWPSSYKSLIKEEESKGNRVYLYNDYTIGYARGRFSLNRDGARSAQKTKFIFTDEGALYDKYYLLYPERSYKLSSKDINKYNRIKAESLAIASLGSYLFSDERTYNNQDTLDIYKSIAEQFSDNYNLALYYPNAYMYKYLDSYLSMSLYATNYNIYSDNVPLIPLILKGYVDYYTAYVNDAPNTSYMLRALDYGAYPSYIITKKDSYELKHTDSKNIITSSFDVFKNIVVENNNLYEDIFKKISNTTLANRTVLDSGIILNEYANGLKIIINYTSNDILYGSIRVSENSFKEVN